MKQEIDFLNPEIISKISSFDLRAKLVVEGFLTGLHKSPYHGFSVEFSEFRQYMPGDDFKKIDWKVFGRTERHYIKNYEDETNLNLNILIDTSASMNYTSKKIKKIEYACNVAAIISYLAIKQRDAVGLTLFDEKINYFIKPNSTKSQLKRILIELQNIKTSNKTNISDVLHIVSEKIKQKGLVIILSDLFEEPNKILNAIKHFRFNKHEVILFHILDPEEINFNFSSDTIFKDMEQNDSIRTQPMMIKKTYKDAMKKFIEFYKKNCLLQNVDYVLMDTKTQFDVAITQYLYKRSKLI